MKNEGLRSYLYEYVFHQMVEEAKKSSKTPIMVSEVRRLRAEVDRELSANGYDLHDPKLPISPMKTAVGKVLSDNVPGAQVDVDAVYQKGSERFMDMIGRQVDGRRPVVGELGARLPVSPYDLRFSNRATVKKAGSTLLYVPVDDIELVVDGDTKRLATTRKPGAKLFRDQDDMGRKLVEAGQLHTREDASGMSDLMGFMSEREYNDVRSWVEDGARDDNGRWDESRYMTAEARARSVALLQELKDQGTAFTVVKDRNPGQIKAQITGTRIELRLTDLRANEKYVGRVYDDGAMVYFTTAGRRGPDNKPVDYDPTPQECVDLLRFAQGKEVHRTDGQGLVGEVRTRTVQQQGRKLTYNDSYYSNGAHMSVVGKVPGDARALVMLRRDGTRRSNAAEYFGDTANETGEQKAKVFLNEAIDSARVNLATALDVERLVADVESHREEIEAGTWSPEFHGDTDIAAIQRSYVDVLVGRRDNLLRPGQTEDEYNEKVSSIGGMVLDDAQRRNVRDMLLGGISYAGTGDEQVREHAADLVDSWIGSYELHEVPVLVGDQLTSASKRFDPVNVARYMTSQHGSWRNNVDIVAAIRAVDEIQPEELVGDSFHHDTVRDRLVKFDAESATDVAQLEDPFLAKMGSVVRGAIERNGCTVNSVLMDENGIIRYEAVRRGALNTESKSSETVVTGEIGQIFAPGQYGEVVTKFNGTENYLFVPGYEAVIVGQKAGETKSVEERTRLRGYEQLMIDKIEYQIGADLLSTRTEIGEPSNLNPVYRSLYDVRHEADFVERSREEGLSEEWREAILATEGRRVRYGNDIKDGSTINAEFQARSGRGRRDESNDNYFDAWVLTGGRNMAIMGEPGDGYFDPVMTSSSTNQGITRYLVEGAVVNADGTITPGDKDDRAPLMKHPDTELMSFDPFDRQQMTTSNLMQAAAVTGPTGTAMMTFGGWNFDDGMVVSKEFSQRYSIRGVDGQMRPLVVGDKLSDLHGNKGVISLVVDPEMDEVEAQEQQLTDAVEVFRANPDLHVVMSPFSAVSRFNGGSARELMQNARDLHWDPQGENPYATVDRRTVENGIGDVRFIVTHMAVDAKTRIYDDEDLAAGRGRKASSQLAWALNSLGCEKVMAECYGTNNTAVANLREMLISTGLDIEPDGTLREGWQEHSEEDVRRLFPMPDLERSDKGTLLWRTNMAPKFGALIGDKGGDLELPFPLNFPTGSQIPSEKDYVDPDTGRSVQTWRMPVLSSHLRSGQEMGDGTSTSHDYTNHYLAIQEQACLYRHAEEMIAEGKGTEKLHADLAKAQGKAQMAFDAINGDLERRRFSGKYNVFREQIMASRMPNSATAVWSADPRLDIDQLAMGPAMAESLGVEADDHVLVWRDPMLRDAGVRYLRVAIDERLTGVSINPVMDKSFDGDFDGDSVAVVKLNTRAAQREAMEKLSVEANLLDKGQKVQFGDPDDPYDVYPLMMHDALDVKVSQYERPGLTDTFQAILKEANEVEADFADGHMSAEEMLEANRGLVAELSGYYRDSLGDQYGGAVLTFGDAQSHIDSVRHSCLETGAKGNEKKLRDYGHYLGVRISDDWQVEDTGQTFATRADSEAVQYATAVKSHGTGVAGTFSQRGMKSLRNEAPKAVLELTYPVTQSILQSKHDPVEARIKYELLMGPVRDLWKGRALVESVSDGKRSWQVERENGAEVQATKERWQEQFEAVYGPHGLNVSVNPDYVREVAEKLSAPDGTMLDIESEGFRGASPMDQLAYGGGFDTLREMAQQGKKLFEGEQNKHFAPFSVRNNEKALEAWDRAFEARSERVRALENEAAPWERGPEFEARLDEVRNEQVVEPEVTVLGRRDVQADHRGRNAQRRSSAARTAGRSASEATRALAESKVAEYGVEAESGQDMER